MESLIEVVNKLQDAYSTIDSNQKIELPQIVVVGSQSSGKSSVLENCVGRDFLPRGSGIVTRRPLVLQLIHRNGEEFGEFLHKPNQKFTDFNMINREITVETDRITGNNKNVSDIPINLRIFSPHVLTLTLVDLPGLTKVAVGDQPKDIDQQIKKCVFSYINNPNSLILAVTPANIDIANSDALLAAKEADPQGLRTIGVITKIDLMDQGTNCRDVLLNVTYPLKRGYVGIVNRSQAAINGRINIKEAQNQEKQFFANHSSYKDIAHKCGSFYLQKVLSIQLCQHIKQVLPSLKCQISEKVEKITSEVGKNKADNTTPEGRTKNFMTCMQNFSNNVESTLGYSLDTVQINEYSFGAKIKLLMTERFPYEIRKLELDKMETRKEIVFAMRNAVGVRSSVFTSDAVLTTICKKRIDLLKPATITLVDKIVIELKLIIELACTNYLSSYISLFENVKTAVLSELIKCEKKTKSKLFKFIELNSNYINTNHQDFIIHTNMGSELIDNGQGENDQPRIESTIFKRGVLLIPSSNVFKTTREFWFVVKGSKLLWYKDETERDLKYTIDLQNCTIRSMKKGEFILMSKNSANLIKDYKDIILKANSDEEGEEWKSTLVARGVGLSNVPVKQKPTATEEVVLKEDPSMFREVEYIRRLIDVYMKIIYKIHIDQVLKTIYFYLITKIKKFVKHELIAILYSAENVNKFMVESPDEQERNYMLQKTLESSKRALSIIEKVSLNMPEQNSIDTNFSLKNLREAQHSIKKRGSIDNLSLYRASDASTYNPNISVSSLINFDQVEVEKKNIDTDSVSNKTVRKLPPRPNYQRN